MTYEEFKDTVKLMVRRQGLAFTKPDDDWLPVLFLWNNDGWTIACIHIGGEDDKNVLFPALKQMFRKWKPIMAAFVISQWWCELKGPLLETDIEMVRQFGVRSRPDRREQVTVEFANAQGASEDWIAQITRNPTAPPGLGPWELLELDPAKRSGRMDRLLGRTFEAVK